MSFVVKKTPWAVDARWRIILAFGRTKMELVYRFSNFQKIIVGKNCLIY